MRQLLGGLLLIGGIVLFIVNFKYIGVGVIMCILGAVIANPVWNSKEMRN